MDLTKYDDLRHRLDRPGIASVADFANNAIEEVRAIAANGNRARLLCAVPCDQYGVRLFLVSSEPLESGPAFDANETLFFACPMPSGAPAIPDQAKVADMHRVIDLQVAQRAPDGDPGKGCVLRRLNYRDGV